MSFTTYREQRHPHASVHCRSDVLLAMQAGRKIATKKANTKPLSNRDKILDIVVIVVWGASIPAVMWLGALGGL